MTSFTKKYLASALLAILGVCLCAAELPSVISADDTATGWASYAGLKKLDGALCEAPSKKGVTGGAGSKNIITVRTRKELNDALTVGKSRIIYIEGIIDMTDTGNGSLFPETVDGSTPGLDALIAEQTKNSVISASTYKEWKTKYTAAFAYNEDQSGLVKDVRTKLNDYWRELVFVRVKANTTIIGAGPGCGIRGGSISIKETKNVVIRNLDISNCYNPFPKVEADDGLNADFDCISIQNSSYVWIDHCTVSSKFTRDQIYSDKYKTADGQETKWQVYDGLCDITNTNDFITVSWCIFRNHDKTMLIGNSDKRSEDFNHQTITLDHDWFDGCHQRLPMCRYATLHILNTMYTNTGSKGIDRRKDCRIYSEGNWFENKAKSITSNLNGTLFDKGSYNVRKDGLTPEPAWEPSKYYNYSAQTAEEARESILKFAGAGKLSVKK